MSESVQVAENSSTDSANSAPFLVVDPAWVALNKRVHALEQGIADTDQRRRDSQMIGAGLFVGMLLFVLLRRFG